MFAEDMIIEVEIWKALHKNLKLISDNCMTARYKVNIQANMVYDKIVKYKLNVQMTSPRKGEERKLIEKSNAAH